MKDEGVCDCSFKNQVFKQHSWLFYIVNKTHREPQSECSGKEGKSVFMSMLYLNAFAFLQVEKHNKANMEVTPLE